MTAIYVPTISATTTLIVFKTVKINWHLAELLDNAPAGGIPLKFDSAQLHAHRQLTHAPAST
jgi:hypothetical protein